MNAHIQTCAEPMPHYLFFFFFLMIRRPPRSTLFPSTPLSRSRPLLLVLATRPLAEPLPEDYRRLRQDPAAERLRLEPLSPHDTLALVCDRLGVRRLPDRSEEHTSELQSRSDLVCRLLLEKKKK